MMLPARRSLEREVAHLIGSAIGEHQYYIQRRITELADGDIADEIMDAIDVELSDAVDDATKAVVTYIMALLARMVKR